MSSNVEKAFGRLNALECQQHNLTKMLSLLDEQGASELVLTHLDTDIKLKITYSEELYEALEKAQEKLCREARRVAYELITELEKAYDLGKKTGFEKACEALTTTINATGGLVDNGGLLAPKGDNEWYDLADAYILACEAQGCEPMVVKEDEE